MDLAKHMNATAAHVAPDVNEFEIAGLTQAPSKVVNVPRVAESPVSFECKVTQIIQLQGADGKKAKAWLTLGEVVAVHIDKSHDQGRRLPDRARPPDRARRPQGRLFRNSPRSHVRDGPAGLISLLVPRMLRSAPSSAWCAADPGSTLRRWVPALRCTAKERCTASGDMRASPSGTKIVIYGYP